MVVCYLLPKMGGIKQKTNLSHNRRESFGIKKKRIKHIINTKTIFMNLMAPRKIFKSR